MQVLEEIGIEFLMKRQRKYSEAGCKVDSNQTMSRWIDLKKEMISKAPSEFEIFPRNVNRSVKIGGRNMAFVNVSSHQT